MAIFNLGNGWTDHSTEGPTPVLLYKGDYRVTKEYDEPEHRVLKGHSTITIRRDLKDATDYVDALVAAESKSEVIKGPTEGFIKTTHFDYGHECVEYYVKGNFKIVVTTFCTDPKLPANTVTSCALYGNLKADAQTYIASFNKLGDAMFFVDAKLKR